MANNKTTTKVLDKNYKNINEMKAAGFTDADLTNLKTAERSKNEDYENNHTWFPEVNGYRLIYSLWNETERKHYNDFKARTKGTGTSRSKSPAPIERNEALIKHLQDTKDDEGLYLYLKCLNDPAIKIYEKFGTFNPTKISAADLMDLLK